VVATSNASSSESRLCANARWVEVQKNYNPKACRFLITDEDVSHLPVKLYNASRDEGPLRYAEGLWYWNWTYIGEFMLQWGFRRSRTPVPI
jgi:hypothetical protein